eukprot:scaffold253612_cov30-Tisochrysis_lutea.AAC.1
MRAPSFIEQDLTLSRRGSLLACSDLVRDLIEIPRHDAGHHRSCSANNCALTPPASELTICNGQPVASRAVNQGLFNY